MDWKQLARLIGKILNKELFKLGETDVTLMTLITVVLIMVVTLVVSRGLRAGLIRMLRRRGVELPGGGLGAAGRLLHYAVLFVGFGIALDTVGIRLGALFAAGAVFAVGIGFAMQNIAQNFVSGVILLVERSIKPGDVVEIESKLVRVVRMGIRATIVRTLDEEDLIVPNSTLVQSTVKNYTLSDNLYRVRVVVGVTYDSDLAHVRKTLETVAKNFERRVKEPEPRVLLAEFGSSSVDYEVSVWTHEPWDCRSIRSGLREEIWWAFKEEAIVIAFPQLDVHFDPPVTESLKRLSAA